MFIEKNKRNCLIQKNVKKVKQNITRDVGNALAEI